MKLFTQLFYDIDQTTKTNAKVAALRKYFQQASSKDILYAIALLTGNKPKRPVKTSELKAWAAELAGVPSWLFDDSYYVVGDLAETIALLLPPATSTKDYALHAIILELGKLYAAPEEQKKEVILSYWHSMNQTELFIFNKLITGNFRIGLSKQLVVKALAQYLEKEETAIAHQLMGKWDPKKETIDSLFTQDVTTKFYQPYPFYLAYPLEAEIQTLGDINDWIIEPKLDGIRGQLIVRDNSLFVWSRGEDLLTDKFPEFESLQKILPQGSVIDGEIIPFKEGMFLDFNAMQTRIGRKNISKKNLTEVPLIMVCYDLLEWQGEDIRNRPITERRNLLISLLETHDVKDKLLLSKALPFENWEQVSEFRNNAREQMCEGVMLKRKDSPYETGRRRGNWWKWKTVPMTIDGVLIYAQSGSGRRANLFTDYTFAVWDGEGKLLPFAKAYSGLTDKEIFAVDNWVKRNTIEKFGPVRSVTPYQVFEIAFEGIAESPRHKSGIALRFPRILRWRKDKKASEANTIDDLKDWLKINKQ
ncbi:MAG: ATP-dependent DNA ligase [Rhizobacter sp.]|nr:ATP-dependent DNA ligase [Ferruginibacter sp.]